MFKEVLMSNGSTFTAIYRPGKNGHAVKSHPRLVRLDDEKKPYVIMDGMKAYLKKVRGEEAMVVTELVDANRCEICGRVLTADESVERGIGPVCVHS
jgi:hypothetical protein